MVLNFIFMKALAFVVVYNFLFNIVGILLTINDRIPKKLMLHIIYTLNNFYKENFELILISCTH